jgi:cell division protein FtsZ
VEAAQAAISSPLLETSIEGAVRVLINLTSGPDLALAEANEAAQLITQMCDRRDANIIFGWVPDDSMEGKVRVTVLATGFANRPNTQSYAAAAPAATPQPTARQLETPPALRQPPVAQRPAPAPAPAPMPAAPPPISQVIEEEQESEAIPKTINPDDLDIPAFLRRR